MAQARAAPRAPQVLGGPRPPAPRTRRWVRIAAFLLLVLLGSAHSSSSSSALAEESFGEEKVVDSPYPPEFRARVNAAIDRGVAWLKPMQRGDGAWKTMYDRAYPLGPTALATLTLLKCGVKPDDPAITKAFAYMARQPLAKTYEVGILLMAIAAKYEPQHETFETDETDRYGNAKPKGPCATGISKEDLAWMKRGVDFLVEQQNAQGVWRYPEAGLDLSNTQYALLGLQAANRCGCLVPPKVWLAALEYLLENQESYGRPVMYRGNEVRGRYRFQWQEPALVRGFRYIPGTKEMPPTGSMTTAGLAGLIICQTELWGSRRFNAELRLGTRRGIRDAMAWLQEHYDVSTNPVEVDPKAPQGDPGMGAFGKIGSWHLYYLYGLERAGILGRVRFLGEHDWYLDGAEVLMRDQAPQGGWGPMVDSCFALLFLKRATSRHSLPMITPSDAPPAEPPPAPPAPAPTPPAKEPSK